MTKSRRTAEEIRVYQRKWAQDHKQQVAVANEVWRKKNRKKCNADARRRYQENPIPTMLQNARRRAHKDRVPFDITQADIIIPKVCPVLGIELSISNGRMADNSPSLDRFQSELGYIKGNVNVISTRANRIKNDASLAEIRSMYQWMLLQTLPQGNY